MAVESAEPVPGLAPGVGPLPASLVEVAPFVGPLPASAAKSDRWQHQKRNRSEKSGLHSVSPGVGLGWDNIGPERMFLDARWGDGVSC